MNSRFHRYILAAMITGSTVSAVSNDHESERRVLELTGRDTVRIPATRARLRTVVENESKSPATAQQVVAQRSQAVRNFLQANKVESLQAGAMTLHPIYENSTSYGRGRPTEIVGYRAQWNATFEVDAERVGKIADGVVAAGVARIANFEFTATDAALADAQQQALRGAALRARGDAGAVLQALGYQPGDVERITVNTGGPVQPLGRRMEATSAYSAEQAQAETTAVEPGFVEVNGSVTIEVGY